MSEYDVRSGDDCSYGRFATLDAAKYCLRIVQGADPEAHIVVKYDLRDAEAAIARVRAWATKTREHEDAFDEGYYSATYAALRALDGGAE